jgi:uncharacterized protein YndB with AHSA1/START domain
VSGESVRRSVTVHVGAEDAFRIFTAEFDSWWPRTHHIGKLPLKRAVMECCRGGRCYNEQEDGSSCDWGTVLEWEPPRRFVLAWQITHQWGYEPDLVKASEVEVTFTPLTAGSTRVDLEHRYFERMGPGGDVMRLQVSAEGGWGTLLQLFASKAGGSAS